MIYKITLTGKMEKYDTGNMILTGYPDGAITTLKDFKEFNCSWAHLYPDGSVNRFGEVIGHVSDIVLGDEIHLTKEEVISAITNICNNPEKLNWKRE
jgi:hypothetical protein